ncbi:MAG: ATP-binding protein [Sphingobacteriales bacterium]|nr:ATP-binding protein [Sphingobacteriales bacterium]
MDLSQEIFQLIGKPEDEKLEYKSVLPPARSIGQMISAFANSQGGIIILGVSESQGQITVNGLSEDFNANSVTHKAIDLLVPKPIVNYQYVVYHSKKVYAIKVEKSDLPVLMEGKEYIRQGETIIQKNFSKTSSRPSPVPIVNQLTQRLNNFRENSTSAKTKFIEHYQSVLNIISDLGNLLYPNSPTTPQDDIEKVLQIRHLYAHRNGIVDEKFLQFYTGQYNVNDEHQLSISELLNHFLYLSETVDRLDKAAIQKYQLVTLN